MDAVGKVQFRNASNIFKQKRNQGRLVCLGEPRKNLGEFAAVIFAHIWRNLHSGDHERCLWIFFTDAVEDRLEAFFGRFRVDAWQAVVCTEFENKNIDRAAQDPVDPAKATGGGFSAQTGVDRLHIPPALVDLLLNQRRISLLWFDSVARGQTVSEKENAKWLVGFGFKIIFGHESCG